MPAPVTEKEDAAAVGADAFDLAHLERATLGDRALQREVLALFDGQVETLLAEIAAAAEMRTRREAAHRLKGAARGVGAFALAAAAEEAEKDCADPAALRAVLARLAARVAEARRALAGLLART